MHIEEETYRDAFSRTRPLQARNLSRRRRLGLPSRERSHNQAPVRIEPGHANLSSVRVDVRRIAIRHSTRDATRCVAQVAVLFARSRPMTTRRVRNLFDVR